MTWSEILNMNSQLTAMNPSIIGEYYNILEYVSKLPDEIIRKILYEFKGFITPSQEIITNLFDNIYIRNNLKEKYNNYLDDHRLIFPSRETDKSYSNTLNIPWVKYKDYINRNVGFTYTDMIEFYTDRLFVNTHKFNQFNPTSIKKLLYKVKESDDRRTILDYDYYFNRFNDDNIQETNNIIEPKMRDFRDELGYQWTEGESLNMFKFVNVLKHILRNYQQNENEVYFKLFSKKELLDRYYSAKGDYKNPETGKSIKSLKKIDIARLIVKYYFKW